VETSRGTSVAALSPLKFSSMKPLASSKCSSYGGKQLILAGKKAAPVARQRLSIQAAIGPNAGTYDPSDPNAEPGVTAIVVADENADSAASDTVPSDVELNEGSEVTKGPSDLSAQELKQQLVDTLYGTDRGLRASSETRAEIAELINQLELANPHPAPTEKLDLLNGKWNLA
jgi:hypothetical protein